MSCRSPFRIAPVAAPLLGLSLMLGLAPARALETQFYDGVQTIYTDRIAVSDVQPGSPVGDVRVRAEVFAVDAFGPGPLQVNTVSWLGAYLFGGTPPPSASFTIRFYDTVHNLTGNFNFAPTGAPLHNLTAQDPVRVDTGHNLSRTAGWDVYHFTAVLPQTLRFEAGKSYALSIFTDTTADTSHAWFWVGSSRGGAVPSHYARPIHTEAVWSSQLGADLAFNLALTAPVPEPSTALLLLAGGAGLAARRWRQGAAAR